MTQTQQVVNEITNRTILQGDVLDKLKEIPNEYIDCIISSPPYWGLRDYGVKGQLGLEPNFRDYLSIMSRIMDELKRVLKKTGTCWINLGDTYAGGDNHSDWSNTSKKFGKKRKQAVFKAQPKKHLIAKSRYGIPERFYINCIDNGWIARNHIPWYKSNSMPSSVKDRFTNKWESVFFFAKEQKYYFNLDAVREKTLTETKPFNARVRDTKRGLEQQKLTGGMSEEEDQKYNKKGEKKQDSTKGPNGKPIPTYAGFNDRWRAKQETEPLNTYRIVNRIKDARDKGLDHDHCLDHPVGKNPGDIFFINPKPFAEAHFATFPVDLPLKILKCACPQQVCSKCGIPRYPISKPTEEYQKALDNIKGLESGNLTKGYQNYKNKTQTLTVDYKIISWTTCDCNEKFNPGIVLDPFFGAGTVGVAAEQLGLQWCGIELNEEYITIAENRLEPYLNDKLEVFS